MAPCARFARVQLGENTLQMIFNGALRDVFGVALHLFYGNDLAQSQVEMPPATFRRRRTPTNGRGGAPADFEFEQPRTAFRAPTLSMRLGGNRKVSPRLP